MRKARDRGHGRTPSADVPDDGRSRRGPARAGRRRRRCARATPSATRRASSGCASLGEAAEELTQLLLWKALRAGRGGLGWARGRRSQLEDSRRTRLSEAGRRLQGHHAAAGRSGRARGDGRAARRVVGAAEAGPRPRRRGARLHHGRRARVPARLRVRSGPQARKAAVAHGGRRSTRSSTASISSRCTPTRSRPESGCSCTTTCSPQVARPRRRPSSSSSWAATVVGLPFIIELAFLDGREKLTEYDVFSLIEY